MINSLYECFQHWSEEGTVWLYSDPHFSDKDLPDWPSDEEQIKNAIVDKWFVLNQKFSKDNVETTLIDENDKVLYNNINAYKYRPKDTSIYRKYICFGNISETYSQPTNVSFDLSECYIKIDDELVSNWNM